MYKVLSEFIEGDHHYKKNDDYPFSDVIDQDRTDYLADAKLNGKVAFIGKLHEETNDQVDDPFKGVRSNVLKKALEDAKIEVPEGAEREQLIELFKENKLTLKK